MENKVLQTSAKQSLELLTSIVENGCRALDMPVEPVSKLDNGLLQVSSLLQRALRRQKKSDTFATLLSQSLKSTEVQMAKEMALLSSDKGRLESRLEIATFDLVEHKKKSNAREIAIEKKGIKNVELITDLQEQVLQTTDASHESKYGGGRCTHQL